MKLLYFALTILIQFISLMTLKLLDSFYLIILIFISCLGAGFLIKMYSPTKTIMKEIGWGVLFGSLTSLTLTLLFVLFLSFNFPK